MSSENTSVSFDKNRLEKFIKKDNYIRFFFQELKQSGNSNERSLNVVYSIILEDESLLKGYEML